MLVGGKRFPLTLMAMRKGQWLTYTPGHLWTPSGKLIPSIKCSRAEDAVRFPPKDAAANWCTTTFFAFLWFLS